MTVSSKTLADADENEKPNDNLGEWNNALELKPVLQTGLYKLTEESIDKEPK